MRGMKNINDEQPEGKCLIENQTICALNTVRVVWQAVRRIDI